jgi:hypothetical protein
MKSCFDQPYDLCVIGAGPAGIIVALEYAKLNPSKKLCLIEYGYPGQKGRNDLDDSIKITNTVNHHEPYECTNKGLGGSSQTWGGRCVMYDEIDFIDRPIVNHGCTWDLTLFEEVKKFLPQACNYFECGEPVFNLTNHETCGTQPIAEGFKSGGILTDQVVERWSMPTNFGKRYSKELANQPSITVLQGFEAVEFINSEKSGQVKGLKIRNLQTQSEELISSAQFVISAGTQETTRMLLRNKQLFDRLDKVPSSLGRFYQGHISGKIASVKFSGNPKKTDYYFMKDKEGVYLRRRFQFSTDFLQKNNLLNTAIWLDNPLYYQYKHRSGAMSFMYLAMITPVLGKRLAPPAIAHSITNGEVANVGQHIWNVLKDFPMSLIKPASIFYQRYCLKRKLPGVFLYSPNNRYALHFHAEQVPSENNKMTLADDGETLIIDYHITDDDVNSVIRLHKALELYLKETGCGELEYWYPENELSESIKQMSRDGIHQSGTTRIANDPETGVVDRDLKIWGTDNVYVCSSSVFPTSGQANPTFFLGAFAVRLARHLSD